MTSNILLTIFLGCLGGLAAGNWITFVYNGSLWISMQGYNI